MGSRCRFVFASSLAVALATAIACSNPAAPPADPVRVDPIQIDTVEVLVLKTAPPEASAHVTGTIGDGCSTLKSVTQARLGKAVTLTILRERPVDAVCSQLARVYDATIPLQGTYPAGGYTLTVNGQQFSFETD